MYKRSSRLESRKHFFSQRIVDHWNKLPDDAVSAGIPFLVSKRDWIFGWTNMGIWALKANSLTSPLIVTCNCNCINEACVEAQAAFAP